jgi:hypothetical protein
MKSTHWRSMLLAGAFAAVGCSDPVGTPTPSTDAGEDVEDVVSTDTPKPTDTPRPTDNPQPRDVASDVTADAPADVTAADVTADAPADVTVDDASTDAPASDASTDAPASDASADVSLDAPADVATDAAADASTTDASDASTADASDAPIVPTGGTCAMPRGTITLPSASPISITSTTVGAMNNAPSTRCQTNTTGNDVVYTLVVTARTGVILSTDNPGTTFDTTLSIRRTCTDAATELSCDDDSGIGTDRGASSVLRAVLDPGTYSVIVDGYSGASGPFTLTATTFAPAANATCATATTLTPGTPLTGQMLTNTGAPGYCAPGLSPGGQLFYAVTLPASTLGTLRVTRAMATWNAALRVYADCDATTCVANTTSSASPSTLTFSNGGTAPRRFIVSVAASASDSTVTPFDITVDTTTIMPGQSCESAQAITPGTPLMGQSTMGASLTAAPCRSENGGQRFFSVSIPAGQRVRVTATPPASGGQQPVLRAFDGCAATTCIDNAIGGTSATPAAASVDIPNSGTTPRTVYVSLASPSSGTAGTWDVAAALSPLVAGQFCAEPVALAPGMTLTNQDARNGVRPSAACSTTVNGGQLYYRLTVPAGQRTVVRAVPAGAMTAWTPTLRLLSTCTALSCLDSNTATAAGGTATLTIANGATTPQDYLLSAAGTSAASGTFNLEAAAAMAVPGYTSAPITASCDDLTAGMPVAPTSGSWSDDSTSVVAALPFTAQFFGTAVTHWSANSNGLLSLHTSSAGSTTTAYSNTTIPSTGTPNGFVAALWDDLTTVATTSARQATLGTAPSRRFVMQWTDFTFFAPDDAARVTYQVKLFETTHVIEIHYCSITAGNATASGSGATIGAEDLSGGFGTQISYNTASAARTGGGYRLTPR